MKHPVFAPLFALALLAPTAALPQTPAKTPDPQREATREQVRQLLASAGQLSDVNIAFRQSTKQPYNFSGTASGGLSNADSLEVVVSVGDQNTVRVFVYPRYNGGYINTKRARDPGGLKDRLLCFTSKNFLYWGAGETYDVFSGYAFTLESGFPKESMALVLRSIRNLDRFVGQLRTFIDGTSAR
jgi:hypothetical protein